MSLSGNNFGEDFSAFVAKTLIRADKLIRAVGVATFKGVILDSPVGNPDLWKSQQGKDVADRRGPKGYVGGRFRANWNCSLGMADTVTTLSTDHAGAVGRMQSVAETADRKKVLWLANSLPYAYRLEYEAWSKQAPAGMVRRNVARVKANISKELNRLKAQG